MLRKFFTLVSFVLIAAFVLTACGRGCHHGGTCPCHASPRPCHGSPHSRTAQLRRLLPP